MRKTWTSVKPIGKARQAIVWTLSATLAWSAGWSTGDCLSSSALAQPAATPEAQAAAAKLAAEKLAAEKAAAALAAKEEEVNQAAAKIEAELGKYKDTAPEAAEAMVKLTDLYHVNGRVYGLVRVAQQFAAAHPTDPRHPAVMIKLLDGLEALSRNKDVAATGRQFLGRYPQAAECAAVEVRVADASVQVDDRQRAAEACAAVWTRQGPTPIGRKYGVLAMQLFAATGSTEQIARGAALGEEMIDKLPAGEFAQHVGWQAFNEFRRVSQWAKSNGVGAKLVAKNLVVDPARRRDLFVLMGENYTNIGQYANAAENLRQARAIQDSPYLHLLFITRLYNAAVKAPVIEPVVNEYLTKYATRPDRFLAQSYLAHTLLRDGDKARALPMLAALLPHDAMSNSNASIYVQTAGAEAPQAAASEAALRAALQQNKDHGAYLRYVLAFEVCRDRLKDLPKAKQVLRELLQQSPSDDGYTTSAVDWLLYNSASDDEFKADVALILKTRRDNVHMGNLRESIRTWQANSRQNKDYKDKAAFVAAELAKADQDPLVKAWIDQRSSQHGPGGPIREQLRQPATFNTLNDRLAKALLITQAEFYRHYGPQNDRAKTAGVWAQYCQRFPQEYPAAIAYLEAATDYSPPEVCKEAALNLLKLEPQSAAPDAWRRLMIAADRSNDAGLAKNALAWILKATEKFGPEPTYASSIGDTLAKFMLEQEAIAYWLKYLKHDRQHGESRECASRLLTRLTEPAKRRVFIDDLRAANTDFHGRYAMWLAGDAYAAKDWATFETVLREARKRQDERPFRAWDYDWNTVGTWLDGIRADMMATADVKLKVISVLRDVEMEPVSSAAGLAVWELSPPANSTPMARLLAYRHATRMVGNEWYDWDRLAPFAQSALERKDYVAAATLASGMLANIPNVDEPRKKAGRDVVTQSYARMGAVGLTLDDNSPLAPLFQATLYLRLGDDRLAFDTYAANQALFAEHVPELPVDFVVFVCDRLIAAGGDENHDRVEETLRGWIVKNAESKQVDDAAKARVQLLLAKNYFKAQRFDIARNEYTTVVNRYPNTPQAIEAEFGMGETYLAQKVFDQAELVFERLARHPEADVVVRAEFLRGVLSFRRGDREEARDIFRGVLERVPNVELANQALFGLAEVYGAEERYMDQLNLLRTVGRLGRNSKRRHVPGQALSIVVHDSDLGISRGHNRIPVLVTTEPGGDKETIYLTSSGAGKGLFRVDLETRLGAATPDDQVLQLTGLDTIKCDYPPEFKAEFRNVPLSDVEIKVASDGKLDVSSSKIVDKQARSFSQQLQDEARMEEEEGDKRVSIFRPENQVKPGNVVYLRVRDPDRDLKNEPDTVVVKLAADSGDQVQVKLQETGPHTGVFEGTATTGELPAGARATDTAIDHNPLMAIDRDPRTFWMSAPDGATPKALTIDLKDLRPVSRVKLSTPDVTKHAPVRGELLGSQDGEFWFRLMSNPPQLEVMPVAGEFAAMRRRVYAGNLTQATDWNQIVAVTKNAQPLENEEVEELTWKREDDSDDAKRPATVVWHGKLAQPRDGAARIRVDGARTAIVVDGRMELPLGPGGRSADIWLSAGLHDLTIFAATAQALQPVSAVWARASLNQSQVTLAPFRKQDFDTQAATARPTAAAAGSIIDLKLATVQVHKKTEGFGPAAAPAEKLTQWNSTEDWVHWDFNASTAGAYEVWLHYAHAGAGGTFQLELGRQTVTGVVADTGGAEKFQIVRAGTVLLDAAGPQSLALKPVEIKGSGLMELRGVTLKPALGASVIVAESDWEFRFPAVPLRYTRFVAQEYRGEAVAISHVEVGGARASDVYVPTKTDVLSLAGNDVLEIAGGDTVIASYTDEIGQSEAAGSQLLTGKLTATYHDARVSPIAYDFVRTPGGAVQTVRKELMRVEPGERIIFEIVDYDEDRTDQRDTVRFQVLLNDDDPVDLVATETENYTGIFTKEIDTTALLPPAAKPEVKGPAGTKGKAATKGAASTTSSASPAEGSVPVGENTSASGDKPLKVKAGDRIYLRYVDGQNTFPGHAVPRESVVYVNEPSEGRIRILRSRVTPLPPGTRGVPPAIYLPPEASQDTAGVAFEAPLTVEVIDPDAAKDSRSSVTVKLATTDGSVVEVECAISGALTTTPNDLQLTRALEEGRFLGQVIMQLGGKNSPAIVPLTADMPRGLLGRVKVDDDASEKLGSNLVTRVLNLTGKDVITGVYRDELRPGGKPTELSSKARLLSQGELACTDREYEKDVQQLHVGEKLFLRVVDPDHDVSDNRDAVMVEITTDLGEKESVRLEETLAHSGIFTGSVTLKALEKPTPANLSAADPIIETYFGDMLHVRYVDDSASTESGKHEQSIDLPVVVGTDGLVSAFTKTFNNETLAVETKFRVAESYFELFKSHKTLERVEEKNADLESGRRVLREVMEDYPDPKYAPRIAYLLGQFAQELSQFDEAIRSYELILRQYSDHPLAADAQYKLAQCFEEAGDFDRALEAYVTLAATHPKSALIPNVMIRISDYFYKTENFAIAAQVGEKFLERFQGHQHAPRLAFRVGQCYYKAKQYAKAGQSFDRFGKVFPDDVLASDALFWSGEAFRQGNNNLEAFRRYNRCRWDYPASEAAKYARGRLALPEMLQQFEAEANSVDQ
jgi:TolA-binding protein